MQAFDGEKDEMRDRQFISDVQRFTAVSAVGVSALRRQGKGIIGRIQNALGALDLTESKDEASEDALRLIKERILPKFRRCPALLIPVLSWGCYLPMATPFDAFRQAQDSASHPFPLT